MAAHQGVLFEDLPEPALLQIADLVLAQYKQESRDKQSPRLPRITEFVLATSPTVNKPHCRCKPPPALWCTNRKFACLVMHASKQLEVFQHQNPGRAENTARFLDTVADYAKPGLRLVLLGRFAHTVLGSLTKPWGNVVHLTLQLSQDSTLVPVPVMFPNISNVTCAFNGRSPPLQQCSQLGIGIGVQAPVGGSSSPLLALGCLPALTCVRVSYDSTDSAMKSQLFGPADAPTPTLLGSLPQRLESFSHQGFPDWSSATTLASQFTALRSLKLELRFAGAHAYQNDDIEEIPISAGDLTRCLVACKSLTSLNIPQARIDDAGLDALLMLGTNLTSLSLHRFQATNSRASSPCSWKELKLSHNDSDKGFGWDDTFQDVRSLACLPLASLTRLDVKKVDARLDDRQRLPQLEQDMAVIASAIARGWTPGEAADKRVAFVSPDLEVIISGFWWPDSPPSFASALAPLGPHITSLCIINNRGWSGLSGDFIRALGQAGFSNSLTTLYLPAFPLFPGFWPALQASFPLIKHLSFRGEVGSAEGKKEYKAFCEAAKHKITVEYDVNVCEDDWEELTPPGQVEVGGVSYL